MAKVDWSGCWDRDRGASLSPGRRRRHRNLRRTGQGHLEPVSDALGLAIMQGMERLGG